MRTEVALASVGMHAVISVWLLGKLTTLLLYRLRLCELKTFDAFNAAF